MADNPETEHRPQPEGEPLVEMKRSASHVALQALETFANGAEWTAGALTTTGAALKLKGKLGSKDGGSNSNDSKD
jgi:hypothetical protein